MDRRNLAFDRTNFILLAVGFAVVIIGFILMSGPGSTEQAFNPDIFSFRRIKLAPVVCFIGFISMIYAVIRRPKTVAADMTAPSVDEADKSTESSTEAEQK